MEGASVACSLVVQKSAGQTIDGNGGKSRKVGLALMRGDRGDLVLKIDGDDGKKLLLPLQRDRVRVHKRFVRDGKATIEIADSNVQLLLSNCPPHDLARFLGTLQVKVGVASTSLQKSSSSRIAAQSFTEISPINAKDVRKIKDRTNRPATTTTTTIPKRKIEESDVSRGAKRVASSFSSLSDEQRRIVSLVRNGKNVFMTGSAGTGKSLVLKHVIRLLPPDSTFVCGSTGIAACHVGGTTLHNFAGIGLGRGSLSECVAKATRQDRWTTCKHLVIDEISMIDGEYFDKLEGVARAVKKSKKPFGGIQLILCGDFLQLPPVGKDGRQEKFCFQANSWDDCIDCTLVLKQVYRQTDVKFIKILQRIRIGRCPEAIVDVLQSTQDNDIDRDGIKATCLSTHNESVDLINETALAKLPGQCKTFLATGGDVLGKGCPIKEKLELKVGAQVVLTKNLEIDAGLVNGARGVIVGFSADQNGAPIVKFVSGLQRVITPQKWSFGVRSGGGGGTPVIRKQLPLKLAWALSIHKSQGMTLDCVEVSLSRAFACGQAYVALSRAKSLAGLRVVDFDRSCVKANATVLKYYQDLDDA